MVAQDADTATLALPYVVAPRAIAAPADQGGMGFKAVTFRFEGEHPSAPARQSSAPPAVSNALRGGYRWANGLSEEALEPVRDATLPDARQRGPSTAINDTRG